MNIYRAIGDVPYQPHTALTIGTFDGVHRGHQAILGELLRVAEELNGRSLVLTFDPHPQEVLRKTGDAVPVLTPIDIKLELLERIGIDGVIIVPFTREFAATPWREFVADLIEHVGVDHMVVGHDHAFGKNREGNAESLREYGSERGFAVTQVGPLLVGEEAISSTKIRRAIGEGKIEEANKWLDRPYAVRGTVVKGDGRGRQLGIPTANIRPESQAQLIPHNGVYCVRLRRENDDRHYGGMANIGVRPTFTDGTQRTIEANLFDFDDELYHQQVTLEFLSFVRFEKTFPSKEAFLDQLELDRATCKEYLKGEQSQL